MSDFPQCQYCGASIEEKPVLCSVCETPHHRDCFEENGKCTTFACETKSFYDPATKKLVNLGSENPRIKSTVRIPPERIRDNLPVRITGFLSLFLFIFMFVPYNCYRVVKSRKNTSYYSRGIRKSAKKSISKRAGRLKGTLATAILRRNYARARELIRQGVLLNSRWGRDWPLDLAARKMDVKMCKILVAAGARSKGIAATQKFLRDANISEKIHLEISE